MNNTNNSVKEESELKTKLIYFGLVTSVVFGIVFGLGELLNYLDSQNLIDDSVRDNIGAILFGAFSQ